jgi:hypothetical protein
LDSGHAELYTVANVAPAPDIVSGEMRRGWTMTDSPGFTAATGRLVGPNGPIPGTSGIVARPIPNRAYLVIVPWPFPVMGPAEIAAEITSVDGADITPTRIGDVDAELFPGAGAQGTIAVVELVDAASWSETAVPVLPDYEFTENKVPAALNAAEGNVRAMLAAHAPGLVTPRQAATLVSGSGVTSAARSGPSRSIRLPAATVSNKFGFSICKLLRRD